MVSCTSTVFCSTSAGNFGSLSSSVFLVGGRLKGDGGFDKWLILGDCSGVLSEGFTVFGDETGVAAFSPAVALMAVGLATGLETGEVGIEEDGDFVFTLGDAGMGEDDGCTSLEAVTGAFGTGGVARGAMVGEDAGGVWGGNKVSGKLGRVGWKAGGTIGELGGASTCAGGGAAVSDGLIVEIGAVATCTEFVVGDLPGVVSGAAVTIGDLGPAASGAGFDIGELGGTGGNGCGAAMLGGGAGS